MKEPLFLSTLFLTINLQTSSSLEVPAMVNCPVEDSAVDVLFANPEDCNSFYQCRKGVPILLPCPNDLQWNDDIKLCDYPIIDGCKAGNLVKSPRTAATDFIPESVIERCKRSVEGTMLADPEDCAGFYVCSSGVPHNKTCSPGLLYHDSLHVCDWPENVDCCENGGETPEVTVAPKPDTTVDPDIPTECSPDVDFIPNFEDCSSYYQCQGQELILLQCPDSLFWNQDKEMCDFPENTKCYIL
ncbi:peritrophin-1-like [Ctenocephalides felis]|uniref:peritrophin-1-like n=1 Tax=Ctenocephalides felis TaxID=7515 RepID=UPI000E6E3845|nr:peritrophin-1-like [Ctenocephalides felis]